MDIWKSFLILLWIWIATSWTGIGYYYWVYLPSKNEKKEQLMMEHEQMMKNKYEECKNSAYQIYQTKWKETCQIVKQKQWLKFQDCKQPSPFTKIRLFSDAYCEEEYAYRETSPWMCVDNEYASSLERFYNNTLVECKSVYNQSY